jgi:hypothetical protein
MDNHEGNRWLPESSDLRRDSWPLQNHLGQRQSFRTQSTITEELGDGDALYKLREIQRLASQVDEPQSINRDAEAPPPNNINPAVSSISVDPWYF